MISDLLAPLFSWRTDALDIHQCGIYCHILCRTKTLIHLLSLFWPQTLFQSSNHNCWFGDQRYRSVKMLTHFWILGLIPAPLYIGVSLKLDGIIWTNINKDRNYHCSTDTANFLVLVFPSSSVWHLSPTIIIMWLRQLKYMLLKRIRVIVVSLVILMLSSKHVLKRGQSLFV